MNQILTHAFVDELEKLAYGPAEHKQLASESLKTMGKTSPSVKNIVTKGALQVDKGMRHPWLPHTDPLHSFPGSQSRATIGKNIATKQRRAVKDIAKSITAPSATGLGLRRRARAYRGLKNVGEVSHQLADISAHTEKPIATGIGSTRLRKRMPKSGYGGGIVSGSEHLRGKIRKKDLDEYKPKKSKADAGAQRRAQGLGKSTVRKVEAELVSRGMPPEKAAREAKKFFETTSPGKRGRFLGEATRDLSYAGRETKRSGKALARLLRRVVRR